MMAENFEIRNLYIESFHFLGLFTIFFRAEAIRLSFAKCTKTPLLILIA